MVGVMDIVATAIDPPDRRRVSNDPLVYDQWEIFKADGDRKAREYLILKYAPLVKYVASKVGNNLPNTIEFGDLQSYGMFGLIDAIDKFDLDRAVKFETYAIARIKGAIIDELRSLDWVPRSVRSKAKDLEKAHVKLESQLGRQPTDEELAQELGLSVQELWAMVSTTSNVSIVTLDNSSEDEDRQSIGDTLVDNRQGNPEAAYGDVEVRGLLAKAANRMNERSKTILVLYYLESMTLAQIGEVLGVTESRVCQLHTKAVLSLREALGTGLAETA
jgi:RNA polymerase sigma factor for flagellar operon FliA